MAQAYWAERMSGTAVSRYSSPEASPGGSYIMAAGLADGRVPPKRFDSTSGICVTCVAWASFPTSSWGGWPECVSPGMSGPRRKGRDFRTNPRSSWSRQHRGPACRTFVLNQLLTAKSAREQGRAGGLPRWTTVVDFGARRAHGTDAACKVALRPVISPQARQICLADPPIWDPDVRLSWLWLCSSLRQWGGRVRNPFARLYQPPAIIGHLRHATRRRSRHRVGQAAWGNRSIWRAVRLDSGDLDKAVKATRARLDTAGLEQVEIFASSRPRRNRIAALLAARCPIDGFGVGAMIVAQTRPRQPTSCASRRWAPSNV